MNRLLGRLINSRSVVSGALLYIVMRWFDRLAGVISTIVLARLLTPGDFGIVAIATIVLGLASVMLDFGINVAVVQLRDLDRDDIDTAWTLRLLQNVVIGTILMAAAGFVAERYHDARLSPVLIVLAFTYYLDGLTGMAPVVFQKRRQYAREVAYFMGKRAGGLVITIVLALWLRNYWALVMGTVLTNVLGLVLSFSMHPVAPRLTLTRWRRFVGASLWLSLHSVAGYASQQLDKLVVGGRDGTAMLGAYSLADQISAMPTSELLAPMSRALLPAMAAVQDDLSRLRSIFLSALGIQATLALPAAVGLALVSRDVVAVMLGASWDAAAPIMSALALAYGVNALTHSSIYLFNSLGRYRTLALLRCSVVLVLALLVLVIFPSSTAVAIAWCRASVAAMTIGVVTWLALRNLPSLRVADMAREVARPTSAALAMAVAVVSIEAVTPDFTSWTRLSLTVSGGALAYTACLAALWHFQGRPEGAERWALDKFRAAMRAAGSA